MAMSDVGKQMRRTVLSNGRRGRNDIGSAATKGEMVRAEAWRRANESGKRGRTACEVVVPGGRGEELAMLQCGCACNAVGRRR